ncbi:hypothetical protein C0J52_12401 [Blattella germanica]|nr:hypothetical protein C0J52_12401 [Blattella germanica]
MRGLKYLFQAWNRTRAGRFPVNHIKEDRDNRDEDNAQYTTQSMMNGCLQQKRSPTANHHLLPGL